MARECNVGVSLNSEVQMPVQQIEMISFMKNMTLMGTILFIMSNGSGPWSLDNRNSDTSAES